MLLPSTEFTTHSPFMMRRFTAVVTLALSALSAEGAIYTFNNVILGPGDTLYADSSDNLLSGSIIAVGAFNSGFDEAAHLTNLSQLLANFQILATVTAGSTSVTLDPTLLTSFPGYTEYDPIDTADITGSDPLIGEPLYVFFGNQATLAGSTEHGLFMVATIEEDAPTEQEYVIKPEGVTPLIGNFGSFVGDAGGGTGTYITLQTELIPEPSSALLAACGALTLLRRRRR